MEKPVYVVAEKIRRHLVCRAVEDARQHVELTQIAKFIVAQKHQIAT